MREEEKVPLGWRGRDGSMRLGRGYRGEAPAMICPAKDAGKGEDAAE
jgi:hypothetical protein